MKTSSVLKWTSLVGVALCLALLLTSCPQLLNWLGGDDTDDDTTTPATVLVTGITINAPNDSFTISTTGGTLQLTATVAPATATKSTVDWTITAGATLAEISSGGLVTAKGDGTVTIQAAAQDASGIKVSKDITIDTTTSAVNTAASPVASKSAGAVAIGQLVTLSTTTDDASIRYTLDGTEPSATSTLYASATPIEITVPVTIKAKAFKDGYADSATASYSYTLGSGFTITHNGTRYTALEAEAEVAVPPLDFRAYGHLFDITEMRKVVSLTSKDALLYGTEAVPAFFITLAFDYSDIYEVYDSLIQISVPWSELATLPKTFTFGEDEITQMLQFDGVRIPESGGITDGSTFTVTSIDSVGGMAIGSFDFDGVDEDNEAFTASGYFGTHRGPDIPATLGTVSLPKTLYTGLSLASNGSDSSVSYYRVPVADCNYSIMIMAAAGMSFDDRVDTGVTFNLEGASAGYDLDYSGDVPGNDAYAGSIHETDGYFDFSVTDNSTIGDVGASYMIFISETYTDTAAFLARYDADDNGDYDDVSPGTLCDVGGTYTTTDINGMISGFNSFILSAQGLADGDEVLYGRAEATGEYIFAVHRTSSGDSWTVSTITQGAYTRINERDPYYVP